jgi:deferrochelatase/peroxidase EfeB
MLRELQVRELAPDVPPAGQNPSASWGGLAPKARLTCLLGFGAPLFDRYSSIQRPDNLCLLGPEPFRKLRWVADANPGLGQADIALQFIAPTELAVNRAVAEVWMLIIQQSLPLKIVTFHGGFNREDRRSWIGFHDGISNVETAQRHQVIMATDEEPAWMRGGTYMAFFRLAIDLEKWRRVPLQHQELIVGRDKGTGAPIVRIGKDLTPIPASGCPVWGGDKSIAHKLISPSPPDATVSVLRASHMHRANPNRDVHSTIVEQDNRIFRQGYEFLEQLPDGRLRLGLNFVSFQGRLSRVIDILSVDGWLGSANFGGFAYQRNDAPAPINFVGVITGGFYAVPPIGHGAFPGIGIF